jgi:carbamoyltransferase
MTLAVNAMEGVVELIPSVIHRDQSARVQTVEQKANPLFHRLLQEMGSRSGHPVLLNTSLNTRNQPMAYKPEDALETFFTSGLDALFLGPYLLTKSKISDSF